LRARRRGISAKTPPHPTYQSKARLYSMISVLVMGVGGGVWQSRHPAVLDCQFSGAGGQRTV